MALDPNNDVPLPKRTLAVLQPSGRVYRVDFSETPFLQDPQKINWAISYGKMVIGKFQLTRNRFLTVDELELENIYRPDLPLGDTNVDLSLQVQASLNGKDPDLLATPTILDRSEDYVRAACRITGKNLSLMVSGQYNMNSFTLTGHVNGRR